MIIGTFSFKLRAVNNSSLPVSHGRLLHAALLDLVRQYDKDLSAQLHDSNVKPFSFGLAAVLLKGKWGFIDTDGNGVIDTETISTSFVGYAPFNNPIFSIIVITPDVSDYSTSEYKSNITKNIVRRVSDVFFQRY